MRLLGLQKPQRTITRRRVKWAGFIATVLVVASYVGSGWLYAGLSVSFPQLNPKYNLGFDFGEPFLSSDIANGVLTMEWAFPMDEWELDTGQVSKRGFRIRPFYGKMRRASRSMEFGFQRYSTDGPHTGSEVLVLPMWFILLFTGVPTAWLSRIDRRTQPGQCHACGYDLAGLADGAVCPECGLRNEAER